MALAEYSPALDLAAAGLATRLASPALLHALNGHLHNALMLADLLGRQLAGAQGSARTAALQRRTVALRAELASLHREIERWQAVTLAPSHEAPARCDARQTMCDANEVLATEAQRLQVSLRSYPLERTAPVAASSDHVLRASIVCGIAVLRQAAPGGAATLAVRERNDTVEVELACSRPRGAETEPPIADELLRALAHACGASFDPGPPLRLSFARARDDDG